MIKVSNLSKIYPLGALKVSAITDIDLQVEAGEFVAIAGPSGSGKSTLLNLLGCIEPPSTGCFQINEEDITSLSSDALADLRVRKIGYIFQTFNLFPVLTAYENVEFPLNLIGMPRAERSKRVDKLLRDVGLASLGNRRPAQLSGGQRQRVAIARALAANPMIMCADEPSANLDQATGQEIIKILKELNKQSGVTLLLATHDLGIMSQADRVVELRDGHIVKDSRCS